MSGQTLEIVNNNYVEKIKPSSLNSGWENLPSIILLEVFSYLPSKSRICASQVCRHWRTALFHPRFWKKITFALTDTENVIWSRCLSNFFKFTVQDVTIRCESSNVYVKEALVILKKLCYNKNLRKLFLEPSRCFFEYPTREINAQKLQKLLLNIIERAKNLDTLSLGCIEELIEDPNVILEALKKHQASNIVTLSLASIKDDPDHYEFLEIQQSLFQSFNKLVILSIDYDHINDNLLSSLSSGIMERLVIHVHGWSVEYLGASNEVWRIFAQKNPQCRLRLNLIHSYNAVNVLDSHILKPSMPLSHIKVLFCEGYNVTALHRISAWYFETLQSIIWIDSINRKKILVNGPSHLEASDNPDPLVLAAWRCKRLSEIVFIGLKYTPDNLLAIVRLRQDTLQRLEFAESDVACCDDSYTEYFVILEEIKDVMGDKWKLLTDEELPNVVKNPLKSDSREVILPMVFQDQK